MELLGVVGRCIGINKPPAGDNGWQQDHNGKLHTDNIYPHGKHQRTGHGDKKPQPGQLPCREHSDTHRNPRLGMELLGVVGQRIGINQPPAGDNGWQQDHNGKLHTDNIHPYGKHQRTGQRDKKPQPGQLPCREHVTLTATPASGWSFSGWSGDASGSTNPLQVTMDGNKTITANFTQITYTLTVNTSGQGSVTRSPNQANYPAGAP
jgi:uncharacterized repeat protein (TIGR02543 family)